MGWKKREGRAAKGWPKGGGRGRRRVESAKRQRGQIPRDSVLSSGAASTPGTRKRGERVAEGWRRGGGVEGVSGRRVEGEEGELISSTHAHWAALPVSRDSPGIPHNIPSPNSPRVLPCTLRRPLAHPLPPPSAPSLPPCPVPPAPLGSHVVWLYRVQDFPTSHGKMENSLFSPFLFTTSVFHQPVYRLVLVTFFPFSANLVLPFFSPCIPPLPFFFPF